MTVLLHRRRHVGGELASTERVEGWKGASRPGCSWAGKKAVAVA